MHTNTPSHRAPWPTLLAQAVTSLSCAGALAQAPAVDFKLHGGVSYGIGVRISETSPDLIALTNANALGLASNTAGGRNQDDGNLNYRKGDVFTNALTGFVDLSGESGPVSGLLRLQGWYDKALEDGSVPWGHSPNGFAADTPLSDDDARARGKFSNVIASEAWLRGKLPVAGGDAVVTLGEQTIGWRGLGLTPGPLSAIDPVDAMSRNRPGSFAETGSIPIAALRAAWSPSKQWSVDSFVQFDFQSNQAPVCGTFFSALDRGEDGCDLTMVNANVGTRSDRQLYLDQHTIGLRPISKPSPGGQFGVKTKWQVAPTSELSLGYARYHSRAGYTNLVKSTIPGNNPFAEGDPRNPNTEIVYPKGIQVFSLEGRHEMKLVTLYGSVGYRPNQPLGYPVGELTQAFVAPVTAASLFRAQERATAAGGVFEGWERRKTSEWQFGVMRPLKNVLGASSVMLRGELNARIVHNLPDQTQIRYARPDVFGVGPVNGVCAAGATATSCTNDGYVTRTAWGYSLQAGATYANVIGKMGLRPRLGFTHNVRGYAYDGSLKQRRKIVQLSIDALYGPAVYTVGMANVSGSTYDNTRDRDYAFASAQFRF